MYELLLLITVLLVSVEAVCVCVQWEQWWVNNWKETNKLKPRRKKCLTHFCLPCGECELSWAELCGAKLFLCTSTAFTLQTESTEQDTDTQIRSEAENSIIVHFKTFSLSYEKYKNGDAGFFYFWTDQCMVLIDIIEEITNCIAK